MACKGTLLWAYDRSLVHVAIGVQLLLLVTLGYAQPTTPLPADTFKNLGTDSKADGVATQLPVTITSISTLIVTELSSTKSPVENSSTPSKTNTSSEPASNSNVTSLPVAVPATGSIDATQAPIGDAITNIDTNPTTELTTSILDELSTHGNPSTLSVSISPSTSPSSPSAISNHSTSGVVETDHPTTMMTTMESPDVDTDGMFTTMIGDLLTIELDTDEANPTSYIDMTTPGEEGILTESFIRLIIIAGATAGSCLVLLIVFFLLVLCYHKRQLKKKNARYYEFKKKDYRSKYEKVEHKNSLARRDHPENTPIGGGWVFNSSGYHGDYEDETSQNVALRSISPLAVATPLLKLSSVDDQNGVPDSGHGGSIAPDDSALGFSPSLEEDIEMELNPLYRALGNSIGTGSEVRDHSYIGGDSDTLSEGNEPVDDKPIRDVLFNSFGTNGRVASEEAVEL